MIDVAQIRKAADSIDKYQKALAWLETWGAKITGKAAYAQLGIRIELFDGHHDVGADEAVKTLESYAHLAMPDIVKTAIQCCRNTIEMERQTIRLAMEDGK